MPSTDAVPPPPVPGAAWRLTRHATDRALDMCVDGAEIVAVLADPTDTWVSPKYPGNLMMTNHRIIVVVAPKSRAIITVLWYLAPHDRPSRFQRTVAEDLQRIRED